MKEWRYQTFDSQIKNSEYGEYFICSNCGEKVYVYIKRGVKIKDIKKAVKCENCGCKV